MKLKQTKKYILDRCPNCEDPDENIETMPDGSCGVCGGKGMIKWYEIGKLKDFNN